MIQRNQDTGLQENVDKVRFQGIELTGDATPIEHLRLRLSYSLIDTLDLSAGTVREEIQNVPGHTVSLRGSYDCCAGWTAYMSWLYVADEFFYARGVSALKAPRCVCAR